MSKINPVMLTFPQFADLLEPGSFYRALFQAIPYADPNNMRRLGRVFPQPVLLYEFWQALPNREYTRTELRQMMQQVWEDGGKHPNA